MHTMDFSNINPSVPQAYPFEVSFLFYLATGVWNPRIFCLNGLTLASMASARLFPELAIYVCTAGFEVVERGWLEGMQPELGHGDWGICRCHQSEWELET